MIYFYCIRRNVDSRSREPERGHHPQEASSSDPSDAIKTYLKSGVHKNDPKKIAEMIRRMKASAGKANNKAAGGNDDNEENAAAKSIFEKYGGGGAGEKKRKGAWRPASKVESLFVIDWFYRLMLFFTTKEPEDYDDGEEEEELPPVKKTFELKTWRPDSYGGGGDRRGSSDLFRKFASKNAGGSFR